MVVHHSPILPSLYPDGREPAFAVGPAAAGQDVLAGDQSIVLAEHSNDDVP
jgi:hypothetical protein